ncbi:hypothetical protein ACKVWC_009646 [Pyricularia oryzae]|nr:hypothetical protein M9X92_001348 [Pyricularia oryzae]
MAPTLWDVPNWGAPTDIACWSMFAAIFILVSLRIFTRTYYGSRRSFRDLGLDDWITITCVVVFFVTCVLLSISIHYGIGTRMDEIKPPQNVKEALKWNIICSPILIWCFSLPKFAVIATLKRILDYGRKTSILFWGLAVSSQICVLISSIWWVVQCRPIAKNWDPDVEGECASINVLGDLGYVTSAYSAILDIFFAVYPIPFIMRLNMQLRSRIVCSIAMGLGVLACAISVYKLAKFDETFEMLGKDPTYAVAVLNLLGMAEGAVLIICSSIPSLGPLYRAIKRRQNSARAASKVESLSTGKTVSTLRAKSSNPTLSSQDWEAFRALRLDDPERGNGGPGRLPRRNSSDVIPLMPSPGLRSHSHSSCGRRDRSSENREGGRSPCTISVQTTVDVTVSGDDRSDPSVAMPRRAFDHVIIT